MTTTQLSPDAASFDPVGAAPTNGFAAHRQFFLAVTGLCREIGLQEEQVFVCANQAAVKWKGSALGKNGRRVSFEGIDILHVNP